MKVGEYVRTRWGCIAKFEGINEEFYEFDNIIMDESSAVREEPFVDIVEKSSPNIIDLIEVGDYVNGSYIYSIVEENKNTGQPRVLFTEEDGVLGSGDIKSIVTKEAFESMEYKIGE